MADVPLPGLRQYWTQNLASLKSECHAITKKYLETASVLQQVYKVLSDIENLSRCTPTKVGESSENMSVLKLRCNKRSAYVERPTPPTSKRRALSKYVYV
jgi:hypothetical protein